VVSVDNVTVSFGSSVLLDHVSFHISETDKIGLTGKNGAGKSTLMKIICGLQSPTSGQIDKPQHIRIGYLPQIMEHHRGRTVLEEAMTAFDELLQVEREIERVSAELAERSDYESDSYLALIAHLNDLNDHLVVSQGEPMEVAARRTLRGLGFRDDELGRRTETFSQGWNMRIELAKILLSKPDLMLLDEPTNHLDIESIEWLEDYLHLCGSSILLVSHDRKFLDNVTNRTVEIMLGHIHDYKVPYSRYLELRAERMQQERAAYDNQQRMIEKTEEFIEKFRYKPTKSNQVQSRIKALNRLERLEIEDTDTSRLSVKFPPAQRSGDVVFKTVDLQAGYPHARAYNDELEPVESTEGGRKIVFSHADIEIKRGEKVALVGRNGEGKTTLIRILMRELEPLEGSASIGHNVDVGYFAQNQEDVLDRSLTVFETLDRIAVGDIRTKLRDILGAFLFKGEDIDKRVSVLSGGERARLGMAKLMLQSHNLLVLDEPTNHMDILSKDVLKKALKAFDGTLLIVSHDRDFLDGLVDKIYQFRDGRVREYLGSVADFLERLKLDSLAELERKAESIPEKAAEKKEAPSGKKGAPSKLSYEEQKARSKEERKQRERVKWLEHEIEKLEKRMGEIEALLAAPTPESDIMELTREYLECKRELDAHTEEWGQYL